MYRLTLAEELQLSPEGGAFRDLVTASSGYGLTSGSKAGEKIELQERGESVVSGDIDTTYETLFSLELFKRFYEHFGSGGSRSVPSENATRDFLRNECGVPERQLARVLINLLADARDWYLIQQKAGGERFVPVELAKEKLSETGSTSAAARAPSVYQEQPPSVTEPTPDQRARVTVAPSLQLNIEIHIDAQTSEDKIEMIFRNMRQYLLNHE